MGKVRRGALWAGFWPAGLIASVRAGNRKRHGEVLEAIRETGKPPPPSNPEAVTEIAARLEAAGMTDKRQRLRTTVAAMEHVHRGASVDEAIAAVTDSPLHG
jgi:hypothetical protein